MKNRYFIFILSAVLFSLSCKKNGSATLEGTVYEEFTNVPIGNVYVRLNKSVTKNGSGQPIAEATTDGNGHYKIKYFKSPLAARYDVDIISGEHKSIFGQPIDLRKTSFTHTLTAYAYLKIRIKNNLTTDAGVNFTVSDKYSDYYYVKKNKDSIFTRTYRANLNHFTYVKWYSHAQGYPVNPTVYDSTFISNKFDTLIYFIQLN